MSSPDQKPQEKARPFHYKSCPHRTEKAKPCGCGRIRSGAAEKLFGVDLTKETRRG